jgi:hypothetical protein
MSGSKGLNEVNGAKHLQRITEDFVKKWLIIIICREDMGPQPDE